MGPDDPRRRHPRQEPRAHQQKASLGAGHGRHEAIDLAVGGRARLAVDPASVDPAAQRSQREPVLGNRADVAPGTLRNHFPTRAPLDAAIVERLRAEAPLPELAIFDGASSIEERLRWVIGAAGAFTDQAARMYRMWLREPMLTGPCAEAGAAYGAGTSGSAASLTPAATIATT